MTRTSRPMAVAGLIAVAVAGYLISQALWPGAHSRTRIARSDGPATGAAAAPTNTQPASTSTAPNRPATLDSRVASGAVSAAVTYLRLLDGTGTVGSRSTRLRAVTIAPLTSQALQAVSATAAVRARLLIGGPAAIEGWQLGWRVVSSTSRQMRVAIWSTGIVVSSRLVVAPDWSTTTCTVDWSSGGWRVAAARTTAGPTPPTPGAAASVIATFVRSASRFEEFGDAS